MSDVAPWNVLYSGGQAGAVRGHRDDNDDGIWQGWFRCGSISGKFATKTVLFSGRVPFVFPANL